MTDLLVFEQFNLRLSTALDNPFIDRNIFLFYCIIRYVYELIRTIEKCQEYFYKLSSSTMKSHMEYIIIHSLFLGKLEGQLHSTVFYRK